VAYPSGVPHVGRPVTQRRVSDRGVGGTLKRPSYDVSTPDVFHTSNIHGEAVVTATSTSSTQDLIRFLLTRIDDDDTELRGLRRKLTRDVGSRVVDLSGQRSIDRLLAECRAKRDVIGLAQRLLVLRDLPQERSVRDTAAKVLCALAVPYRAHPSFRDEWAHPNHW
jgi:hypothetical protein